MIGALGICGNGAGCVGASVACIGGEHVLQKATLPRQRALLRLRSRPGAGRLLLCVISLASSACDGWFIPLVPIGRARLLVRRGCAAGEYARGATQ